MSQGPAFQQVRYPWDHFVAASGEAGRWWAGAYRGAEAAAVRALAREALQLLLRRDVDAGRERLDRLAARLDTTEWAAPSVRDVLERWYYGARAYLGYCVADFDLAERDLAAAERALVRAIDRDRFLLPVAQECPDFPHQRIRIARNRRRWEEMRRQIGIERDMMADRLPLCVLGDGQRVHYATIAELYRSLPGLDEDERAFARAFLDPELRLAAFERNARSLYALSGLVIPYP